MDETDQPHLDFLDAIERAESESQVIAVSHLMKAMPSTPTAVLAWLERRFPQEWGRTERHELTGALIWSDRTQFMPRDGQALSWLVDAWRPTMDLVRKAPGGGRFDRFRRGLAAIPSYLIFVGAGHVALGLIWSDRTQFMPREGQAFLGLSMLGFVFAMLGVLTAPFAYAAAGAGWITDGALVVTVAGGGGLLVCAPIMALEGAAHGSGEASAQCFANVAGAVLEAGPPGVGRGVYRATRSWRCPDHVQLAREVRAVASCHSSRNAPGDAELARLELLQLRSDRGIWECLPPEERREVQDALEALGERP